MINISLCMIVKNEESVIGRCLESVADLVDEFVIVDTGSTDATATIVSRFTSKIYTFNWIDDFAAARNFAFEQATMDYILWLDADDVIMPDERAKLLELKQMLDPNVDSVTILYHLCKDEYGNITFSLRRNRLVRRSRNFRWIGPVHEYLQVGGYIFHSDIAITHLPLDDGKDSDRNLKIYERRLANGEKFTPRDLYYYANELKDHGLTRRAIDYYEIFLNEGNGWIEDNISACGKLADCYHDLGDSQSELKSTIRSLQYDRPRPEFCCRLGYHFLNKQNYDSAIYWYQSAIQGEQQGNLLGFFNPTFSTWLPHLQLSVCYDKVGNYGLASQHNEIALRYRPNDSTMLKNREYFQARLKQKLEDQTEAPNL